MRIAISALVLSLAATARAADTSAGDALFAAHFERETARIESQCLADVNSLADWNASRPELQRQLREMLGLDPLPERTDLKATVTGTLDAGDFRVERLHFQSRPGLYVTANLYVPKELSRPAPAVLYLCGHAQVKRDGVSYGNKVHYQHHAIRYAREGMVCLVIDTLQLGEIEGVHHGTYREGMWWWLSRGYTSAGVEAWNGIRALDYLQSRTDVVDPDRLGVAGRSGGGAHSWYLAALDERVKAAVPTAGITDLRNHVVDGVIAGHCDCMFPVNTYRWDFAQLAALAAPRAVLFQNTDRDRIFPLDGVLRVYGKLRDHYDLHKTPQQLGPTIGVGGHDDTPELQVAEIRWLKRHLIGGGAASADKAEDELEFTRVQRFEPQQLNVFKELPPDSINARIHETFVPSAPAPTVPTTADEWARQRDACFRGLTEKVFRGWPSGQDVPPLDVKTLPAEWREGVEVRAFEFTSQPGVRLRLDVWRSNGRTPPSARVVLRILHQNLDDSALAKQVQRTLADDPSAVIATLSPRGVGPTAPNPDPKNRTHIRRRFVLLGQTLESMQAWDVRRAVQALRSLSGDDANLASAPLWLQAAGPFAGIALYASLFEPNVAGLELHELPATHRNGPHFLNVLRVLDMPAAVALAAERSTVRIVDDGGADAWRFAIGTAESLGWGADRVTVVKPSATTPAN